MDKIHKSFKYGSDMNMGFDVIVEENVIVGNNVKLGHRAILKSGTIIGDNVVFDDNCITTGACYIGNNVNVRTGAIVSKATIIEDYGFIGPGVITNHTKNVNHGREEAINSLQLLTYIGYGSIIGSQASILAGVKIAPLVIIGGGAVVVKNIIEKGIYVGAPVVKKMELPSNYLMDLPKNAGNMYNTPNILKHLKTFLPALHIN